MLAVLLCAFPAAAFAQQETATIAGTVTDATGAVVPHAVVVVTNVQTGITVRTAATEAGTYVVPSLRPGDYSVAVESKGFQKTVRTGVTLQVAQVARIDVTLQTGGLTEAVEVVGATPLLDTLTSSRGSVIDQKKIVELPLNGRDYNQLALLSPGVLPGTPRLASVNFKGVLNVNGNRTFNNVFLLDGVDNISYSNSFRGENVQLVQPSIEALQEFKIQTNAYSAEFGRSSGAVVNATIKSGTNTVRGSVYEFLRNDRLDANNFFSNALGAPKPKRERNQFGGAAGGPLVKNRTFWFGDYEGLRDLEGVPRVRQVPTAAEKAGLFSAAVVDPFASGPARVQPQRPGPVGDPARALGPGRRGHRRADPGSECRRTRRSTRRRRSPTRGTDQFDVRIDHQISANHHPVRPLQLRRYPDVPSGAAARAWRRARSTMRSAPTTIRSQGLALGLTWTVSPTLVGDIRFGYSRGDYYTTPPNYGVDGAAAIGLHERPERSGDRGRRAQGQHPGVRCGGPAHLDAAVPDAPLVEPARDVQPQSRRPLPQVRRRVPPRADADQRPERHHRPDELRESLHQPRRRRSAARAAVAAGAHQLHRHGSGAGHAVLLPPGRLPHLAQPDREPRPALRVRDAAARTEQPVRQLRSGNRDDDLRDATATPSSAR